MSDADQIIGLYRRHAKVWVKNRTRFVEKAWIDRFISLLGDQPHILDIGCGSGQPIARYLLDNSCTLTGVDASPEILALAEEEMPQATWLHADMRNLDLNKRFDGILAWHSSFHLTAEDQRTLFPMFQNHATPGAILMFTCGPSAGVAMGTFEGEPLYHASLDPEEYRTLLDTNGFDVIENAVEDPDAGGATLWLARYRGDR